MRGEVEVEVLAAGGTTGSTESDGFLDALGSDALRDGLGRVGFDVAGSGVEVVGAEAGTLGETEGAFGFASWGDFLSTSGAVA